MAGSTFLVIGVVGLVLLGISAFLGADDADLDTDLDVDGSDGSGSGGGVLEWLSVKSLAVAAVGFGFVGWATTSNGNAGVIVWTLSIATGLALWALAVKLLFPWLKQQQGDDLQPLESYQGLTAEVVVRIPANGVGTVQLTDPSGTVVRRDARSTHRDHEVARGTRVLVVLSTAEHVVVDEFSFLEDLENS
jgi:hypothetical protein